MFTRISFGNYRAFKRGTIRIAPITILVGANSIGKSSILQLPLLFKQTRDQTDDRYRASLKIHGKHVSFGNAAQVFHNQRTDEPVFIRFDIADDGMLNALNEVIPARLSRFQYDLIDYAMFLSQTTKAAGAKTARDLARRLLELRSHRRPRFDILEMTELVRFISGAIPNSDRQSLVSYSRNYAPVSSVTPTDYELTDILVHSLAALRSSSFSIRFELTHRAAAVESVLQISNFQLWHEKQCILALDFEGSNLVDARSDMISGRKIPVYMKDALSSNLDPLRSVFTFFLETKSEKAYLFQQYIETILATAFESLNRHFSPNAISHIGPLRAHPKRFYFLDTAQPGSSEGELMIEALRENEDLQHKINGWLRRFGLNITVSQFQEIIYRLSVRNQGQSFDLDLTDVGFGISQILPILVEGFLSAPGKTILIEQPEIHLHPRMQADLGDLFMEITGADDQEKPKKHLIVETHSEYLLNRLRARVAQRKLRNTELAIHNVSRVNGYAEVKGIYVPEDGSFEWPAEFLDTELDDMIAYLNGAK